MKPLVRGEETDLIEIPASWYLDDLPPMMFIKGAPNSHGFVNPRHLEEIWRDQFDYVYREEDYAVFAMTIHPDVSGRPQVILMLERMIEHINGHDGVRWATMDEIADDFKRAATRAAERLALDDLLCGLGVDPAAEAQLLLDAAAPVVRRNLARIASTIEEGDDHHDRDERRRRAQGVQVGPDRGGLDQADDLERQRVVEHEQHGPVEVVPGQREPEQERAEDAGPDERQASPRANVLAALAPRSRAASSMWSS